MSCKNTGMYRAGMVMLMVFTVFPQLVRAEVPQTMNYQGYLTNASGAPVNATVDMTFSI